jgi:hypothetical protein
MCAHVWALVYLLNSILNCSRSQLLILNCSFSTAFSTALVYLLNCIHCVAYDCVRAGAGGLFTGMLVRQLWHLLRFS